MSTASALTTAPAILPDRVDARSLRDLTIVDALFLYAMARAGEEDAKWLADISANHWEGASDCRKVRSNQAVRSVLRLVPPARREAVRKSLEPLLQTVSTQPSAARFVVRRKRFGSIRSTTWPRTSAKGILPVPGRWLPPSRSTGAMASGRSAK